MPTITIDGRAIVIQDNMSIIDAARSNGIEIPALGYDPRVSPPSTQEIAIVELIEGEKTRFAPATSTPAHEGMIIRTRSEALSTYRTIYLQDLLRYHYGDCEAPCTLRCPAGIHIQRYLYHAAAGNFLEAVEGIKERNPLPLACGRVCPHPCEDDCRRSAVDKPVNINGVKRFSADWDRVQACAYKPPCRSASGKRVAVVGAGPAGREMPVKPSEIDEALEDGVAIHHLTAPVSIISEGGLLRLVCMRMELGEPDKSGRRRPVPVAGSEFSLSADTIISAIGQAVVGGLVVSGVDPSRASAFVDSHLAPLLEEEEPVGAS